MRLARGPRSGRLRRPASVSSIEPAEKISTPMILSFAAGAGAENTGPRFSVIVAASTRA